MVSTFANRNLTTNRKNHNFGYGLVFFGSVSGFGSVMCSPRNEEEHDEHGEEHTQKGDNSRSLRGRITRQQTPNGVASGSQNPSQQHA